MQSRGHSTGPLGSTARFPSLPPAAGRFGVTISTISDAEEEEFSQKESRENNAYPEHSRLYTFYWKKKFCTSKYFGKL